MKRFFALLGGLLTLPAFAENALIYRDEVILNNDYHDGGNTENVSATSAGRASRRGDAVAGRSVSRAVPSNVSSSVSSRNAAGGRVVASTRSATVVPTVPTAGMRVASRTGDATVSRTASTGAVRTGVSTRRAAVPASSVNASRIATTVGSRVRARATTMSTNINDKGIVSISNSDDETTPVPVASAESMANVTASMDSLAQMTSYCKAQYAECMDNFCNVLDDNQGRCSCSKNIKNYEKTETALKQATEALQDVAQQIQYIGLSKYEIETLFSQTEAELQMQNTTDNSQLKNSLDKIKGLIVDIKPGTAASSDVTAGVSMDLSGLLDFNIGSAGFDLGSLFGTNTTNTASISNQRGEQLYKTAAARCKTAVLTDCQSQGVDIAVVSNAYDLEIDKQCVAYERSLTDANDEMRQTVRNAQSVLQRARLMVAQQKNAYDLRGCINALDSCMQDDYVCGNDYENCLDPSGKYIVNGEIVIGSTPGQAVPDTAASLKLDAGNVYSTDGLYATWNYASNKKNAWGSDGDSSITEGSLSAYITDTVPKTNPVDSGETMSQYLAYKIGYISDSKNYGMCSHVLNKCQDYTFTAGSYVPDNRVVKEYLMRTMVQIKAAQDKILADYAEACISDVTSCLGENNYDTNNNIAINACRSMIKTCMSVNGDAGANPTPVAMATWVKNVYNADAASAGGTVVPTTNCYGGVWGGSTCACYDGHTVSGIGCFITSGPKIQNKDDCTGASGTWDVSAQGCYCERGHYTGFSAEGTGTCA